MATNYWNGSAWVAMDEIKYYNDSSWITIGEASYYDGSQWVPVYSALKTVTLNGGNTSKNIKSFLDSQGITSGKVDITLTGNFYGNPALRTGDLSNFKEVHIINNGLLSGSRGSGGSAVSQDPSKRSPSGGAGGTAFYIDSPVKVTNNGTIRGGGGGGGSGGSAGIGGVHGYVRSGAGGAGAGAGSGASNGGSGDDDYQNGVFYVSGAGGRGGNFGSNGSNGVSGYTGSIYTGKYNNQGYGGAGGKATVGNSKVTWLQLGSVTGSRT